MTVKEQFSEQEKVYMEKVKRFADTYLIFGLVIGLIAIAAIVCSVATDAFAQALDCTVYYHAGVVTCAQPPAPTATATQKPKREGSKQSDSDAGYPAPGQPISTATPTATVVMPYPPPISGDPNETQPPIQTPDFEATYQADLCMHAGLCTPTPTSTPRATPTLAPTMEWPAP